MRSRRLAVLLAAIFLIPPAMSIAADKPIGKPAAQKIEYGNLYFGTDYYDGWAGYAGVLYAPHGMHLSGLRLSVFGLYGTYDYGTSPNIDGRFYSVDALVGWSFVGNTGAVTLAVGPNYQNHKLSAVDLSNPVQGSKWGAKVQGDFWVNPTPLTVATGVASYSTAFDTYYSIFRFGYDFPRKAIYFGPEAGALGNDRTDQQRLGAFISGFAIGAGKVTVSGGYLHDRHKGSGGYGSASIDFTF
jgi:Cellulose biosynthesis protein BcsS